MKEHFTRFNCSECGSRKCIINCEDYAYKIGTKKYCCYTCYMRAYRKIFAKRIAKQEKLLQRIKNYNEREINC